ncbi:MAG TPA: hypothetical protein VKA10_00325 [Prolixibacteraceae bacterium]|nr:hypothetical protein [Prolixibacteraceae bacterium]
MKKLLVLVSLVTLVAFSTSSAEKMNKKDVLGEWKYEVADAQPGYDKGTIVFFEKDNVLKGEVKFSDGSKVEFKSVEIKDDWMKFDLYVEYERITGKVKIDGKKMKGSVNTPDGEVPLTAEKVN